MIPCGLGRGKYPEGQDWSAIWAIRGFSRLSYQDHPVVPQSLRPYLLKIPDLGVSYFFIPELIVVTVSAIGGEDRYAIRTNGTTLKGQTCGQSFARNRASRYLDQADTGETMHRQCWGEAKGKLTIKAGGAI